MFKAGNAQERLPQFPWDHPFPEMGQATFVDFARLLWEWLIKQETGESCINPRSLEQTIKLIADAYQASLQVEEGRGVRFRLVFRPGKEQITLRFDPPLPFDVRSLVKISPTIGLDNHYLAVEPIAEDQDALHIVGISNAELSPAAGTVEIQWYRGRIKRPARLDSVRVSAYAPGHLRVETTLGQVFDLHEGSIGFPVSIRWFEPLHSWHRKAALTRFPWPSTPGDDVADGQGSRSARLSGIDSQASAFSAASCGLAFWLELCEPSTEDHSSSFRNE